MQKIVRTRNGFALTDFFANQTKFRVVRTGPKMGHTPKRGRGLLERGGGGGRGVFFQGQIKRRFTISISKGLK